MRVTPWASVSIDGEALGDTPMEPVHLEPGTYTVVMSHPSYVALPKVITIRPGETTMLEVNLRREAFKTQQ